MRKWVGVVASRVPRLALGGFLIVAAGLNVANVVGRYVFGAPIPWADEAMVYAMVASIFIGAAPVAWEAAHLRMDLLLLASPRWLARGLEALALVASIAATGFVCWQSIAVTRVMWRIGQTSPVLEMPTWILHATVALGLALATLATAAAARAQLAMPRKAGAEGGEKGAG